MIDQLPAGTAPSTVDGTHWPFVLISATGAPTLASDSISQIVDTILTGHRDAGSSAEQFEMRYDALTNTATRVQAGLYLQAQEDFPGDLNDELDEFGMTAIMHPKDGAPLEFRTWPFDVPLVLHATNYAPYTDLAAPAGENIIWADATNERSFLDSLVRLGVARLMTHSENAKDTEPDSATPIGQHPTKQ